MQDKATKINLLDYNLKELSEAFDKMNQKSFRAKQVYKWLNKGVGFDNMSNVPKVFLERLAEFHHEGFLDTLEKQTSSDGTIKYLFGLADGNTVETVLLKQSYGNTICISTQVGCKMKCDFCVSGMHGFGRDLTAGEMLAQVICVNKDAGLIKNIVLMGMGEPFDNYDNVVKFLRLVNDDEGVNIGFRNITLSTCGIVPKIIEFSTEKLPITLAISLHAPNDEIRKKIMPIAEKYTIHEVIDVAKYYFNETGRRVTLEYILMDGVNDSVDNAFELAKLLKGFNCNVNLIAFNSGSGTYKRPTNTAVKQFLNTLEKNRITATLRKSSGGDIDGACGQLRSKTID